MPNTWNQTMRHESSISFTHYVWVWSNLSGSLQGAGGICGLLYLKHNGAVYIPCYDANGNITAYIDESGNIVAEYKYDAFGNTVAKSGTMADEFKFRFSTKYYDTETGFYYYGYRYYNPVTGRWLNRDRIEELGGVNLYGFCENDGVNRIDPFGLKKCNCPEWGNGRIRNINVEHSLTRHGEKKEDADALTKQLNKTVAQYFSENASGIGIQLLALASSGGGITAAAIANIIGETANTAVSATLLSLTSDLASNLRKIIDTQIGYNLWSRVCYQRCDEGWLNDSWNTYCDEWERYKEKLLSQEDNAYWFTAATDAMNRRSRAANEAMDRFKKSNKDYIRETNAANDKRILGK